MRLSVASICAGLILIMACGLMLMGLGMGL